MPSAYVAVERYSAAQGRVLAVRSAAAVEERRSAVRRGGLVQTANAAAGSYSDESCQSLGVVALQAAGSCGKSGH